MSFRRALIGIAAFLSAAIVIVALLASRAQISSVIPFIDSVPENSISSLPGGDGPVLVVKIDDTSQARPQIGLEYADIVYIEQVEGGLTRLAAIFSSKIPQKIGPVRSARISDVELLAQYGHVGFAYSGVQKKMRPVIDAANLEDLGAQKHSATIYTHDDSRISPYAMVLRADLIMEFAKDKALNIASSKNMGWKFGDSPQGGVAISSVHLSWPASSYDAMWSQEENRWLLNKSGTADFAASGIQLGPKTLVIQNVSITDSIYKDKVGGVTPYSATVGTGTGFILRDGKYFEATWTRADETSGTIWKTLDGTEISFAKGQIWVALTEKAPVFTTIPADAPSPATK